MRAAIIPADPALPIRIEDVKDDYKALGALVGGYIECIWAQEVGASMYLNEEGKLLGLDRNERATRIAHASSSIRPTDFIAGDAVLVGMADSNGNDTDLPEDSVAKLHEAAGTPA